MGVAEIAYRLHQLLRQHVERILLKIGWKPGLNGETWSDRPLFGDVNMSAEEAWHRYFELDLRKLDQLVKNRIDLFSYHGIELNNPVNWLKEPVSGINTPFAYGKGINYRNKDKTGDIKIIWELGRQQYLVPLAVGYLLTGDSQYKEVIRNHIESWIESCPFGYTVHWCSSLEVALRAISWSHVHGLLVLGGMKEGLFELVDDKSRLRDAIYQHAWFIRHYLSLYSSANNHLIGELTGLWTICSLFDLGVKGERWADYAARFLEKEADKQVYADGVDKEQAIYYHYWVLEYLVFSFLVANRTGKVFSTQYVEKIRQMAGFLEAVTPAGGLPPQIGDADDGVVARFSISGDEKVFEDILASVDILMSAKTSVRLTEKAFWYSLMAGVIPEAVEAKDVSTESKYPQSYCEGGYAVLGDDTIHIVFDAGPLGYTSIAAHGHADALSICLAVDGEWWLVDPGTFTYHDNADWRNYFRGTSAHNTVLVDNQDQSKIGGDFLWVEQANAKILDFGAKDGRQWVLGTHDGYRSAGVIHDRTLEYLPDSKKLTIKDTLKGSGRHSLRWHFHLGPDVTSEFDSEEGVWALTHRTGTKRLLIAGGDGSCWTVAEGQANPILGWYSGALGSKTPIKVLRYHYDGPLPKSEVFTFTLEQGDLST